VQYWLYWYYNDWNPAGQAVLAAGLSTGLWPVTIVLVSTAVATLMASEERLPATRSGGGPALRGAAEALPRLATAFLPIAVAAALLDLTAVGAPIAAWLTVRYQFPGPGGDARGQLGGAGPEPGQPVDPASVVAMAASR
jgi:hypothetical protein